MHYEGPIYRPPSEADSVLVQATVGCPHNRCTFCMVYKQGPRYKVRPVEDIKKDLLEAAQTYGSMVSTLFFPAGNTIAMKTRELCDICKYAHQVFPQLDRITVYGSCQYIHQKGLAELQQLADSGLTRIHVGLESGDDIVQQNICKGTNSSQQIEACNWMMQAGIEVSLYVLLGIGGKKLSQQHAEETARVLNRINPDFIRLRTFLPKIHTPILADISSGKFQILGPLEVLHETRELLSRLNNVTSQLSSDHYTNYIDLKGKLPGDTSQLLQQLELAMQRPEKTFRPVYIGNQ